MIKIKNVSKSFGNNKVLSNIDLNIEKGEVISLIGSSGSGKSTLLRCINQLEIPETGELTIDDQRFELSKGPHINIDLRKKTGMVFQNYNLFDRKTALENVMEGLIVVLKTSKSKAKKIAKDELNRVNMLPWQNHYPMHLSGGQKQRVAIARALAMRPDLLLFDEPTSALDPELVNEVLEVIKEVANEGYTMLLVSHEMSFVKNVSDRVLYLYNGQIVEQGRPKEIFQFPKNEHLKSFLANITKND